MAAVWLRSPTSLGFTTMVRSSRVPLRAVETLVLSRSGGAQWRAALALNPCVPDDLAARTATTRRLRSDLVQVMQGRALGRLWTLPVADQVAAAQLGSLTVDQALARSPRLHPEVLAAILRTNGSTQVQPDTLVRLVEHVGTAGARLAHQRLGVTRLAAALPYSELLGRTVRGLHVDQHDLSEGELSALVDSHLGDSAAAWGNFCVLSVEWTGTLLGLLETSGLLRRL